MSLILVNVYTKHRIVVSACPYSLSTWSPKPISVNQMKKIVFNCNLVVQQKKKKKIAVEGIRNGSFFKIRRVLTAVLRSSGPPIHKNIIIERLLSVIWSTRHRYDRCHPRHDLLETAPSEQYTMRMRVLHFVPSRPKYI